MLSKSPEQIDIWEILILLESKMTFVDCVNDKDICEHTGDCPVRPIWGKAFQSMQKYFQDTTLEDILHDRL